MQDLADAAPVLAAVSASEPVASPLTVFAPNNAAFESISAVVEGLTAEQTLAVRPSHDCCCTLSMTHAIKLFQSSSLQQAQTNKCSTTCDSDNLLFCCRFSPTTLLAPSCL